MSSYVIDGIGDEVTILLGIFLAIFVVIVSWMSTRVDEGGGAPFEINDLAHASAIIRARQGQPPAPTEVTRDTGNDPPDITTNAAQETTDNVTAGTPYASDTSHNSSNAASASESEVQNTENVLRQRTTDQTEFTSGQGDTGGASNASQITIKLKFMNDTTKTVQANPDETLDQFRRRNFPPETASRYRLIYGGQVLRDGSRTLRDLRLVLETPEGEPPRVPAVHCFLSPVTNTEGSNAATSATRQLELSAEELHIGSFFLPIIGVVLIGLWYLCVFYTSLFSIQSLVSILGLTFLYVVLLVNQLL